MLVVGGEIFVGSSAVTEVYQGEDLIWSLNPYYSKYLTFNILSGGTLCWIGEIVREIEYSVNDGPWVKIYSTSQGTEVNVESGDVVRWKGNNESYWGGDAWHLARFIGGTAYFNIEGNIMSMVYGDNFIGNSVMPQTYTFIQMFSTTNVVNAENLILPTNRLTLFCYGHLFSGCGNLVEPPRLTASHPGARSYYGMFADCTSLTHMPYIKTISGDRDYKYETCDQMFYGCSSLTGLTPLRGVSLGGNHCHGMFGRCTSLATIPSDFFQIEGLSDNCFRGMFDRCSSLVNVPTLPWETFPDYAEYCFREMFSDCTSLVNPPSLPATTLSVGCYYRMFAGCTSLASTPRLPAKTLLPSCYEQMFSDCTSLTAVPNFEFEALSGGSRHCEYMFAGCTSLSGTATLPAVTAEHSYRAMFTLTNLQRAVLPAVTLEYGCYDFMFYRCSNLNYIKCIAENFPLGGATSQWVYGVSQTGTFVKSHNYTSWEWGVNGIPENWDFEDA